MKLPAADAKRCINLLSAIDEFVLEIIGFDPFIIFEDQLEIRLRLRTHWQNKPKIVEKFIKMNSDLPEADIKLIKSWIGRKREIFFVTKHNTENPVFLSAKSNKIYAPLALTDDFDELLPYRLPILIETSLIPYKNHIICDGLIIVCVTSLSKTIAKFLINECIKAEKEGKLIACF